MMKLINSFNDSKYCEYMKLYDGHLYYTVSHFADSVSCKDIVKYNVDSGRTVKLRHKCVYTKKYIRCHIQDIDISDDKRYINVYRTFINMQDNVVEVRIMDSKSVPLDVENIRVGIGVHETWDTSTEKLKDVAIIKNPCFSFRDKLRFYGKNDLQKLCSVSTPNRENISIFIDTSSDILLSYLHLSDYVYIYNSKVKQWENGGIHTYDGRIHNYSFVERETGDDVWRYFYDGYLYIICFKDSYDLKQNHATRTIFVEIYDVSDGKTFVKMGEYSNLFVPVEEDENGKLYTDYHNIKKIKFHLNRIIISYEWWADCYGNDKDEIGIVTFNLTTKEWGLYHVGNFIRDFAFQNERMWINTTQSDSKFHKHCILEWKLVFTPPEYRCLSPTTKKRMIAGICAMKRLGLYIRDLQKMIMRMILE